MPHGLQSLNLNGCFGLSADSVSAAALRCGLSLRRLSFNHCTLPLKAVAEALAQLVRLEDLEFNHYYHRRPQDASRFFAALAKAPHLHSLMLSYSYILIKDQVWLTRQSFHYFGAYTAVYVRYVRLSFSSLSVASGRG